MIALPLQISTAASSAQLMKCPIFSLRASMNFDSEMRKDMLVSGGEECIEASDWMNEAQANATQPQAHCQMLQALVASINPMTGRLLKACAVYDISCGRKTVFAADITTF